MAPRPEWLAENFYDAKSGPKWDEFGKHFAEQIQPAVVRDAAEQVRRNTLPANPDAYKPDLPADFKLPDGIKFEFNLDDPLISQFKALAHAGGMTQENFTKALGLYAGAQVSALAADRATKQAELAKLGATALPRINAIETFYKGLLGDDLGGSLSAGLSTEKAIRAAENLIMKFSSQGAASFRQDGRIPAEGQGRVSEAEYAAMTPAQRWDYAKSFDQNQFNKSNGAAR